MPLKSFTTLPPGGFSYTQPETKMTFRQYLPIREQANLVLDHRKANTLPRATYNEVVDDIEEWTCLRLNNDPEWCIVEAQKKTSAPLRFGSLLAEAVQAVGDGVASAVVGARIIFEWWGDGGRPVDSDLAQRRADVCLKCPFNSADRTWLSGLSEAAKEQLEFRSKMKMIVAGERELGVCTLCACPLKLKVHTPTQKLVDHTPADVMADLDKVTGPCWVRDEIRAHAPSSHEQTQRSDSLPRL